MNSTRVHRHTTTLTKDAPEGGGGGEGVRRKKAHRRIGPFSGSKSEGVRERNQKSLPQHFILLVLEKNEEKEEENEENEEVGSRLI